MDGIDGTKLQANNKLAGRAIIFKLLPTLVLT